jgi:hypothetical protein
MRNVHAIKKCFYDLHERAEVLRCSHVLVMIHRRLGQPDCPEPGSVSGLFRIARKRPVSRKRLQFPTN